MYSSEDLEIKCKSNTNKLAYIVEVKPLLLKDFIFSIKARHCLMANVKIWLQTRKTVSYNTWSIRSKCSRLTPANIGMAYAKYRANENESKFTWLLSSAADIHKITVKSNV